MPTCNVLDFSLIQEYYTENISDSENPKNDATNLCCYESLPMSYDTFVDGVTDLYNSSCVRDREFSDYVTKLFTQCLSGSTGGVTKIIAGTNLTISPPSGLGDVTINATGGATPYWSGNTDGTISNSGLTFNVGIGTQNPTERLTVSGDTSANPVRIQTLQTNEAFLVVVDDTGVLYQSERSSRDAALWSAGTHDGKATIISSGDSSYVGVGTENPNEILTVVGSISATTNLYFNIIDGGTY
jgi:hypothetical protein|tara:strand:+ start:592 stop:1317 length:726 start_codon:yes stop_codon:yes gene_type:complete